MSWVHLSISTISQLLLPWFWSIVAKRHFLSNIPIFNKKNVWILLYWIKWNRVIYQMCFCLFIPRYTRIQNFLKLCFEHNFLTQSFWLNLYSTFFLDQTSFDQNIFWTQKCFFLTFCFNSNVFGPTFFSLNFFTYEFFWT